MEPLRDKREGACADGPCRMPHRCWQYVTCFIYGNGEEKVDAGGVGGVDGHGGNASTSR